MAYIYIFLHNIWHSFLHILWHYIWDFLSGIYFDILSVILRYILTFCLAFCIWHSLWHGSGSRDPLHPELAVWLGSVHAHSRWRRKPGEKGVGRRGIGRAAPTSLFSWFQGIRSYGLFRFLQKNIWVLYPGRFYRRSHTVRCCLWMRLVHFGIRLSDVSCFSSGSYRIILLNSPAVTNNNGHVSAKLEDIPYLFFGMWVGWLLIILSVFSRG